MYLTLLLTKTSNIIMKNKLLSIALLTITSFTFAQGGKTLWKSTVKK